MIIFIELKQSSHNQVHHRTVLLDEFWERLIFVLQISIDGVSEGAVDGVTGGI